MIQTEKNIALPISSQEDLAQQNVDNSLHSQNQNYTKPTSNFVWKIFKSFFFLVIFGIFIFFVVINREDSSRQKIQILNESNITISHEFVKNSVKNNKFNLWDLQTFQKQDLMKKYERYLKLRKDNDKDKKIMDILSNTSIQSINYLKKFEQSAQQIKWSQKTMNIDERNLYKQNLIKLKKDKFQQIQILLDRYKQYKQNNDLISQTRNIKKFQFYRSIKFHQIISLLQYKDNNLIEQQKKYLQEKYQINKYNKQLKSCIIIPTYNNVHKNRYLWNIESILQQQYNNYKVIIIDDASNDHTSQKIAIHLQYRNADPQKYILIRSKIRNRSLYNFYYAAHKYCGLGQIIYVVDGDDQLIGTQVFKTINTIYQKQKPYTLYTIFIVDNSDYNLTLGNNHEYSKQTKDNNAYRIDRSHGYSHLRTMLSDMFLYVDSRSLKYRDHFYQFITDNAVYFCAMQLSCGRIRFLQQINYWYDYNTGNNIFQQMNIKKYRGMSQDIQKKLPYKCFYEYLIDVEQWMINYDN